VNERVNAIYQKGQVRLAELVCEVFLLAELGLCHGRHRRAMTDVGLQIDQNSTLPCTISSIHVLNAPNTRKGFLQRIFDPLLSVNKDRPYTLQEALKEVSISANKLNRFGMTPSTL
jgi:outer membrane protein insertion porin family